MADIDELYRAHSGTVYRYLFSLCRDTDLAEELTQETFYRACINLRSLRSQEHASAWLCSIGRNAYFAWYRQSKQTVSLEDTPEIPSPDCVSEDSERKELIWLTKSVLNALEEPYREVFRLNVYGEVSLKEISNIYGKSESWARVTFYRARQKIKKRLENLL